jgi:hypothetical protein
MSVYIDLSNNTRSAIIAPISAPPTQHSITVITPQQHDQLISVPLDQNEMLCLGKASDEFVIIINPCYE